MSSSAAHPLAGGCIALFGLPFFAGGVLMLVNASGAHAKGADAPPLLLGGLLMAAIGGGLVILAAKMVRAGQREAALRVEFPEQPWRWRPEWSDGEIAPTGKRDPLGTFVVAVIVALACALFAYPVWTMPTQEARVVPYLLLVIRVLLGVGFPVLGLAILGKAVHRALQARRFGRPHLSLGSFPIPLGGRLRGRLTAPIPQDDDLPMRVQVRCLRTVVERQGGKTTSREVTEWSGERFVIGVPTGDALHERRFDLVLDIPASGPPTGEGIRWIVEATCHRPGLDFSETWEVPVFEVPVPAMDLEPLPAPTISGSPSARLPHPPSRVRIEDDGLGVTISFPAALNPGLACIPLVFSAIGSITAFEVWRLQRHLTAALIALPTLLIARAALAAWLQTTTLHARRDGLEIVVGVLGLPLVRRTIPRERIPTVSLHSNLSVGATPYHRLEVAGRRIGPQLSDAMAAEAVRAAVARGLGMD